MPPAVEVRRGSASVVNVSYKIISVSFEVYTSKCLVATRTEGSGKTRPAFHTGGRLIELHSRVCAAPLAVVRNVYDYTRRFGFGWKRVAEMVDNIYQQKCTWHFWGDFITGEGPSVVSM